MITPPHSRRSQTRLVDIDAHSAPAAARDPQTVSGFVDRGQSAAHVSELFRRLAVRVALAATFVCGPDAFAADEPTTISISKGIAVA